MTNLKILVLIQEVFKIRHCISKLKMPWNFIAHMWNLIEAFPILTIVTKIYVVLPAILAVCSQNSWLLQILQKHLTILEELESILILFYSIFILLENLQNFFLFLALDSDSPPLKDHHFSFQALAISSLDFCRSFLTGLPGSSLIPLKSTLQEWYKMHSWLYHLFRTIGRSPG